jgi:hypothetical protein
LKENKAFYSNDTEGLTRKVCHALAKVVGKSEREGNITYGSLDLAMSAYGLNRLVRQPDAWRLFRYVRTDYVRAYKTMTPQTLILEGQAILQTGKQMHEEMEK